MIGRKRLLLSCILILLLLAFSLGTYFCWIRKCAKCGRKRVTFHPSVDELEKKAGASGNKENLVNDSEHKKPAKK